jgi:hypothetical protein
MPRNRLGVAILFRETPFATVSNGAISPSTGLIRLP